MLNESNLTQYAKYFFLGVIILLGCFFLILRELFKVKKSKPLMVGILP